MFLLGNEERKELVFFMTNKVAQRIEWQNKKEVSSVVEEASFGLFDRAKVIAAGSVVGVGVAKAWVGDVGSSDGDVVFGDKL